VISRRHLAAANMFENELRNLAYIGRWLW